MSLDELRRQCHEIDLSPHHQRAGVYILLDGPAVVYVGSSKDVDVRIGQHLNNTDRSLERIVFNRAWCLALPVAVHRFYEGALIRALRPKYNGGAPADRGYDEEILTGLGLAELIPGLRPMPRASRRRVQPKLRIVK